MFEVELKFAVPPGRLAKVRAQARRGSESLALEAIYFDTENDRLFDAGLSLRLRHEAKRWMQTLKAPGRSTAHREEDDVRGATAGRSEVPAPDAALHSGTPAGAALAEALGTDDLAVVLLQEKFRTDVVRHRRIVRAGGARVEVALDEGSVVAGKGSQVIREIEFELKAGAIDAVFAQARHWVERHGLWIESRSKAERGMWLSRGEDGGPPVKAMLCAPREVRAAGSELELLRAIVGSALRQVLANASEVAAGRETVDHVHQLRVGLRRVRTALRAFGEAAPELGSCELPMAHAFRALGDWRDAGVTRETIVPRLHDAGAPEVDLPSNADERRSPVRLARGKALQLALLQLMEFAAAQSSSGRGRRQAGSKARLDALLDARLDKLHKQVKRAGRHFESLSREQQHRARKRLKRLRYLAEFVAPRYRRATVKRYLAALEPAQDALGAHNDAAVALERYRTLATKNRDALFAVGWLTARLEQTAADSHDALKSLNDVQRFWR